MNKEQKRAAKRIYKAFDIDGVKELKSILHDFGDDGDFSVWSSTEEGFYNELNETLKNFGLTNFNEKGE